MWLTEMKTFESKWVNYILNYFVVNSFKLVGLQIMIVMSTVQLNIQKPINYAKSNNGFVFFSYFSCHVRRLRNYNSKKFIEKINHINYIISSSLLILYYLAGTIFVYLDIFLVLNYFQSQFYILQIWLYKYRSSQLI